MAPPRQQCGAVVVGACGGAGVVVASFVIAVPVGIASLVVAALARRVQAGPNDAQLGERLGLAPPLRLPVALCTQGGPLGSQLR